MIFIDETKDCKILPKKQVNPMIVYCTKKVQVHSSIYLLQNGFTENLVKCDLWVLLINELYENNGLWYRSVGFTND